MLDALDIRELLGDELVERGQSGYALDGLSTEIQAALEDPDVPLREIERLYDELDHTGLRPDWGYEEPSAFEAIVGPLAPGTDALRDRLTGCSSTGSTPRGSVVAPGAIWASPSKGDGDGKSCGVISKWRTPSHWVTTCRRSTRYRTGSPLLPWWREATRGNVDGMARDDDTDYTMLALRIFEKYGPGFTSADVGAEWLLALPFAMVYTAERVAYRNLIYGLQPPATATYRNPYREWIGALIRGDMFGYVWPGDAGAAARVAYQDAALSHTANGIYGEMWAAALVAAAFSCETAQRGARSGSGRGTRPFPSGGSRADHHGCPPGWGFLGSSDDVHGTPARRVPLGPHDQQREVVTAALLWGDGDFSRTIGLAVEAGLDTDCTGATAGSVFGALHGRDALPTLWTTLFMT